MPLFDESWLDLIEDRAEDEEWPTVKCGVCGTEHAAPECKWNDAEEDEDVKW